MLAAAGLSAGLVVAALTIRADLITRPEVSAAGRESDRALKSYNDLVTWIRQPLTNRDRVANDMNRLLGRLENSTAPERGDSAILKGLIQQVDGDLETLRRVPPPAQELRPFLDELIAAEASMLDALRALKSVFDEPDAPLPGGPDIIARKIEESNRGFERFTGLGEKFLQAHGLHLLDQPPKNAPPSDPQPPRPTGRRL
jgi:hypothetical protein